MNLQKLADVQNAVAGGKCTIQIPSGPNYDGIAVELLGASATLARIDNPRFSLNGKPVREFIDAAELDFINQYYGYDAAALPGFIYLPFRRIEVQAAGALSTVDAERLTMLRSGDAGPMTLSFDIDAAYVDASATNIKAYADIAPGAPQATRGLTFTRRTSYNFGGAGTFPVNDIPRLGRVLAHHILKNDCSKVSVKRRMRNGLREVIWDEASKTAIQEIQDHNGRVPVAARTVIDYCVSGNLDESVALVDENGPAAEYELSLTLDSGGAFDIVTEYIGTPDQF